MIASYCGRKNQKLTWKNDRISHQVLCPLLGHWRMAKKGKKGRERNGIGNGDRSEDAVRVFETCFESICPRVKKCAVPSPYYDGLTSYIDPDSARLRRLRWHMKVGWYRQHCLVWNDSMWFVLSKLICRLISIMIMNSMCGLATSKWHLLHYEDSSLEHCITLVAHLHYFGKAIHRVNISLYKQLAQNQSSPAPLFNNSLSSNWIQETQCYNPSCTCFLLIVDHYHLNL